MGKKVIEVGAPAYMAQYTALMTILLAFFILLNTLTEEQEAGFNAGIGDVRNAFGINGGLGLFQFSYAGSGAANPVATEKSRSADSEVGFEKDLLMSEGGPGNTAVDYEDEAKGEYMRIRINYDFPEKSPAIPDDMMEYLSKIGMGIQLFNYDIAIRCYATDFQNLEKNAVLSYMRAFRIMQFLNRYCHIPYSRMLASGTCTKNYFQYDVKKEQPASKNIILEKERGDKEDEKNARKASKAEDADDETTAEEQAAKLETETEPKPKPKPVIELDENQGTFFYVFLKNIRKKKK